jgi:hypothetical protein
MGLMREGIPQHGGTDYNLRKPSLNRQRASSYTSKQDNLNARLGRLLSLLVRALDDVDRAVLEENLGRVLARLELLVSRGVGSLDSDERAARSNKTSE